MKYKNDYYTRKETLFNLKCNDVILLKLVRTGVVEQLKFGTQKQSRTLYLKKEIDKLI